MRFTHFVHYKGLRILHSRMSWSAGASSGRVSRRESVENEKNTALKVVEEKAKLPISRRRVRGRLHHHALRGAVISVLRQVPPLLLHRQVESPRLKPTLTL